jgi:hypothetical protein
MTDFLGESLIFLISQPRAGSTLLQRMLAGHPAIQSSAEPWLMLHPLYALREDGISAEYEHQWARLGTHEFLSNYASGDAPFDSAIRAYARTLYSSALRPGQRYFLDKTPRYYEIIPDLLRLFPRATFVFLLRNPLAVLASVLRTWMPNGYWPYLATKRRDLLAAPQLLADGIASAGARGVVLHYEALIAEPETAVAQVVQRLGLSYSADLLTYAQDDTVRGTMGDPTGVFEHNRPNAAQRDRWLHDANRRQIHHFLSAYLDALDPHTVTQLGYDSAALRRQLAAIPVTQDEPVLPWRLALTPHMHWPVVGRLRAERALAVQRQGARAGRRAFWRLQWRRLRRGQLRPTLRIADPGLEDFGRTEALPY